MAPTPARGRRSVPRHLTLLLLMVLPALAGCGGRGAPALRPAGDVADSAAVMTLIGRGDREYAQKTGYSAFARSLKYYDSALALAERSGDTLLLAEAVFAKGRVYDAWNKDPQQTIRYFSTAADWFRRRPSAYRRALYVAHLTAHAYDKVPDSARATAILRRMYRELSAADTALRRSLPFIPEMALIATEVRAYGLADSILRHLTRRDWIANDSTTYNYLDHYYLTQSRLDACWRKPRHSAYLDSLQAVYEGSRLSPVDRVYYSNALAILCQAAGRYRESAAYYSTSRRLEGRLNTGADVSRMQQALSESDELAEARGRKYAQTVRRLRVTGVSALAGLLAVITLLAVYLARRNKLISRQSASLSRLNEALDRQVAEVALLHLELQHRVKNNLQMIYSLLHLQERQSDDEETVRALQLARLRVESIAALHHQIRQGEGAMDIAALALALVSSVAGCLSQERQVVTHITAVPLSLPPESGMALSLILNEWVTNTVKYARPAGNVLEIVLNVTAGPGGARIEYRDNGDPGPVIAEAAGLGSQIVTLLCRQTGAVLTREAGHPYHYLLCIPYGTENKDPDRGRRRADRRAPAADPGGPGL